jgi:hypothetical protein
MYAVLPTKAKPSKSISKDETRPHLTHANLVRDGDSDWTLLATDGYQLVRVPVYVMERAAGHPLEPGPIPADALKAIEKAGAFTANKQIVPVDPANGQPVGPAFERTVEGKFPNFDMLWPVHEGRRLCLRFNASLLWSMAQSLGITTNGSVRDQTIELEVDLGQARTSADNRDVEEYLRPIIVRRPTGDIMGDGLLMPVRRS